MLKLALLAAGIAGIFGARRFIQAQKKGVPFEDAFSVDNWFKSIDEISARLGEG